METIIWLSLLGLLAYHFGRPLLCLCFPKLSESLDRIKAERARKEAEERKAQAGRNAVDLLGGLAKVVLEAATKQKH
jgi:hypothetical protein